MVESVFVFGAVVFGGLMLVFLKLPVETRRWLLGHPVKLDVAVTALAFAMHWGTMTGLMAAAMAGMMTSLATTMARRLWGYREGKRLVPGALGR